jgi:tagaturonate reductase
MRSTSILQFGTSRFLQAHADLFISDAMAAGQDVGPICVVQSSGDPARAKRLAGLVGSYPVRVEGLIDGAPVKETHIVTSVSRTLSTATDWQYIAGVFAREAQIILSNTGDSGFAPQSCDDASAFDQSMSYPAKLTHLLRLRFAQGAEPIQIMPMELIADNGAVLKARVMALAAGDSAAFQNYLAHDVIWVNSLVDRIVSQPIEPAGAVAEPYALWAIEDQPGLVLPCVHPSVQVVPSLSDIEALKLFVLNLGHTVMANRWIAAGRADGVFVRHLMNDKEELGHLKHVLGSEVRPAFDAAGQGDAYAAYVATTLDRFANPYLDHKIADIAQNHVQKVARRIKPLLDWARAQGDQSDKPVLTDIVARN